VASAPARYQITVPYHGREHTVVVEIVSDGFSSVVVRIPHLGEVRIEKDEIPLLEKCGLAKRLP
jgi:hypothetical protein